MDRRLLNPALGVSFGKLRPETIERLERILKLRGLPPPPWKAQVSFGLDAVTTDAMKCALLAIADAGARGRRRRRRRRQAAAS